MKKKKSTKKKQSNTKLKEIGENINVLNSLGVDQTLLEQYAGVESTNKIIDEVNKNVLMANPLLVPMEEARFFSAQKEEKRKVKKSEKILVHKSSDGTNKFQTEFELPARSKIYNCICGDKKKNGPTLICSLCGSMQHFNCLSQNANMVPYQCPLCLISRLDPLMQVERDSEYVIAKPFIVPTKMNSKLDFSISYTMNTKSKRKGYLRCIRLDGSSNEHSMDIYY